MLPLVFPESHTKDSRGLFLQDSAGWSDPGLVGTPGHSCEGRSLGRLCLPPRTAHRPFCTRDKGRVWTEGFLVLTFR